MNNLCAEVVSMRIDFNTNYSYYSSQFNLSVRLDPRATLSMCDQQSAGSQLEDASDGRRFIRLVGVGRLPMNFDEFTGQVQHRLQLSGTGEAVRATRATLSTLGERIPAGAAADLAASLPMEIRWYLTGAVHEHGQRFDWAEFLTRVSEIEGSDRSTAAYHARVIVDLVRTQVPASDFQQLRDQLPEHHEDEDWGSLFEVVDGGGWGEPQEAQIGGESTEE